MIPAIIDRRSIRTLLPQSKRHIAAAKNTVNIIAEAPTIVFVINSLGKSIMAELTLEERVSEICKCFCCSYCVWLPKRISC